VDKPGLDTIIKTTINALPGFKSILTLNNARIDLPESDETHFSHIVLSVKKSTEPSVTSHRTPVLAGSRPEFYDFDLFKIRNGDQSLLDTRLTDLTYTVFDTETTGLNPEGGDEIISMGAVRIVNGRLLSDEVFEELVNPRRDIPVASYRIHGINQEMVAEKDPIEKVLPRFRQFVANTVLVGHNIAFDMKLLKLKEQTTRVRFANPVLDTLLLSAMLHPVHEQHDMETIARRLGIAIIGRHTALGDALTAAEIFLKLIPILNSNGILTLGDAMHASKKSYYARVKY
jgi:DNA polymerase-3 subunit epsilon